MTSSLSRVPESSEESLSRISESIKQVMRDESQASAQLLADRIGENPGLLNRLFPSAVQKENQRLAIDQLRQLAQRKETMMAWYAQVQMEIARKQGDAVIASTGVYLQEKLASFAALKLTELELTIDQSIAEFIERYEPKKARIVATQDDHPELYERARQSLAHMLDTHFDTMDELLSGFKAALKFRAA